MALTHFDLSKGSQGLGQKRCQLQVPDLRNEWRLILIHFDDNMQLLRQTTVETGTQLYLVCNNEDISITRCENGNFVGNWPPPPCAHPLQAEVITIEEEACTKAGHTPYAVGFHISCDDWVYFFELYRICFDRQQMTPVYSVSKAYPFRKYPAVPFSPFMLLIL